MLQTVTNSCAPSTSDQILTVNNNSEQPQVGLGVQWLPSSLERIIWFYSNSEVKEALLTDDQMKHTVTLNKKLPVGFEQSLEHLQ